MSKRYVIKPAILLHMEDGESKLFKYGEEVDSDDLAPHQVETAKKLTVASRPDDAPQANLDSEANLRAALADSGQPNSTSSPIPGNYGELETEERIRFVQTLDQFPSQQAIVLAHELRTEGSKKVFNAGVESAQIEANQILGNAEFEAEQIADLPQPDLSDAGDPDESAATQGDQGPTHLDAAEGATQAPAVPVPPPASDGGASGEGEPSGDGADSGGSDDDASGSGTSDDS